jgi:hypothetical protein
MIHKCTKKLSIKLVSHGEFRLGSEGYGLILLFGDIKIECLKKYIVFVNTTEEEALRLIDYSSDEKFLIINGALDKFIVNIQNKTISLYRTYIHSADGEIWCEETPIFGDEFTDIHVNDTYLEIQFPFVDHRSFNIAYEQYHQFRLQQIEEAKKRKFFFSDV